MSAIMLPKSLHRVLFPILSTGLMYFAGLALTMASPASPEPVIPGKLVDVGGYRLHIYCEGQGFQPDYEKLEPYHDVAGGDDGFLPERITGAVIQTHAGGSCCCTDPWPARVAT